MKKILPYKLNNLPVERVKLPVGAEILTILDFNGEPTLFAVVDPKETEVEERVIKMAATGKEFEDEALTHIGSFPVANYGIVYHFFATANSVESTVVPVADLKVSVKEVATEKRLEENYEK